MKDPYIFDFVSMKDKMIETDIEHEMVNNVSKLLLELGKGFAYIGEQYPLKVQDEEFFIDLLFYNYLMHCFFAVELKTGKFVPEYALKDMTKPIGVSEYRLFEDVPKELQDTVPSLEDIGSRIMDKYKCE